MTTLLIAEHDNASIKDATNKALTAAAALGADVHVLVAGENAKAAADAASKLAGVKLFECIRAPTGPVAVGGTNSVGGARGGWDLR